MAVAEQGLVARSLGLLILANQAASLEQRPGSGGGKAPGVGAAEGKGGQFGANLSQEGGQSDSGEEFRDRLANLGISGAQ